MTRLIRIFSPMPAPHKALSQAVMFAVLIGLSACTGATKPAEINPTDMPAGPGLLSGESGNILAAFKGSSSGADSGGNLGVNSFLWRATLESLSFMPINQADSQGGVIATDWYSNPQEPTKRVRANVLILGKSLKADALQVTLFQQTKAADGWQNAAVNPVTVRTLEDQILTRARALRVESLAK
jgi:hypothetical protein